MISGLQQVFIELHMISDNCVNFKISDLSMLLTLLVSFTLLYTVKKCIHAKRHINTFHFLYLNLASSMNRRGRQELWPATGNLPGKSYIITE